MHRPVQCQAACPMSSPGNVGLHSAPRHGRAATSGRGSFSPPVACIIFTMVDHSEYVALSDEALLAQCDVHVYKSSGPGGQHRNKVSSAVRLRHGPTGITAHGDESRSQHDNKKMALRRLRMNIACRLRRPIDPAPEPLPGFVTECIFSPRGRDAGAQRKMQIGRKDSRFWRVGAFLLDVLEAFEGRLADSAGYVGISTANFSDLLRSNRHLFTAAQQIRKAYGRGSIH